MAARLGWPIADAWALIIRLREGLEGKEGHKAYRRDYIASTLALAYRDVEPEDDQQSAERIERLVEQAAADPGAAFESGSIDFLAALRARDPAAYERARARLKKAHVRVAALDQEVERRKPETRAMAGKGKALELPEPEPWPEPVDGAELIAAGRADQRATWSCPTMPRSPPRSGRCTHTRTTPRSTARGSRSPRRPCDAARAPSCARLGGWSLARCRPPTSRRGDVPGDRGGQAELADR